MKGQYFKVLDHGFISLVDVMGSDADVEQAARVSFGKSERPIEITENLIRHLMRERHTSPFEQIELKFHVRLPIFVARQWIRHRTANVNEMSGRYSEIPDRYYMPEMDIFCGQSESNKQGRSQDIVDNYDEHARSWRAERAVSTAHYRELLSDGVSRELARLDLPLSTYTEWFWKIDLHNCFHFLGLRADSHAQYEIRVYANIIAAIVRRVCPISFKAWSDYQFNGTQLSWSELATISKLLKAAGLEEENLRIALMNQQPSITKRELDQFCEKFLRPNYKTFDNPKPLVMENGQPHLGEES